MHSNSEGLSPSLRAQLGVGWDRALPAPFDFANGWKGDGSNDYFSIPSLIGETFPTEFTISFWVNRPSAGTARQYWNIQGDNGNGFGFFNNSSNSFTIIVAPGSNMSTTVTGITATGKMLIVLRKGAGSSTISVTIHHPLGKELGVINNSSPLGLPDIISSFEIGRSYFSGAAIYGYHNQWLDEFALHQYRLSDNEIDLLYNNGLGNNAPITEHLLCWFDFERAESETDLWGVSSPIGWTADRWGIRDKSGNNHHAMQIGMTNNASLGGTLQTLE